MKKSLITAFIILISFLLVSSTNHKTPIFLDKQNDNYHLHFIIPDTNDILTPNKCAVLTKNGSYYFDDIEYKQTKSGFLITNVTIPYSQYYSHVMILSTKYNELPITRPNYSKFYILLDEVVTIKQNRYFEMNVYRIDFQIVNKQHYVVGEYLNGKLIY